MSHTKYNCPLINPCTNCDVKGDKTDKVVKKKKRNKEQMKNFKEEVTLN